MTFLYSLRFMIYTYHRGLVITTSSYLKRCSTFEQTGSDYGDPLDDSPAESLK
ncbi:hypothetical protein SBF1_880031 [Candidatus Desulfosporosinus infrequens]|uniref:Uncharacterized protein n=1 Tax=Candidatus Desulfosporosinus infrequens TaxID=2043169 RepID=A0A2U3LVV6_9FIRM|nr:hypothetical protein SBF1_880031 [Candidatus Desulfosporosinus infrequens]